MNLCHCTAACANLGDRWIIACRLTLAAYLTWPQITLPHLHARSRSRSDLGNTPLRPGLPNDGLSGLNVISSNSMLFANNPQLSHFEQGKLLLQRPRRLIQLLDGLI